MKKKFITFSLLILLNSCVMFPYKYEVNYNLKTDFSKYGNSQNPQITNDEKQQLISDSIKILNYRIKQSGGKVIDIKTDNDDSSITVRAKIRQLPDKFEKHVLSFCAIEFKLCNEEYTDKAAAVFSKMNIDNSKLIQNAEYRTQILKNIYEESNCPDDLEIIFFYNKSETGNNLEPQNPVCLEKSNALNGTDIKSVIVEDQNGQNVLNITTTETGKQKLSEATRPANLNKRLAIVSNNRIICMPIIKDQIASGKIQITSSMSKSEANDLADAIKNGILPIQFNITEKSYIYLLDKKE